MLPNVLVLLHTALVCVSVCIGSFSSTRTKCGCSHHVWMLACVPGSTAIWYVVSGVSSGGHLASSLLTWLWKLLPTSTPGQAGTHGKEMDCAAD